MSGSIVTGTNLPEIITPGFASPTVSGRPGAGNDTINALGGFDAVSGGAGNDTINGGAGADSLSGDGGQDILRGDADDDVMRGGEGADTLDGGAGDDIASYADASDPAGNGTRGLLVNLSAAAATLGGVLVGAGRAVDNWGDTDVLLSVEGAFGTALADVMLGGGGDNFLGGNGGEDDLRGGGGDDNLRGGSGADMLDGGSGSDAADYIALGDAAGNATRGVAVNLSAATAVLGGDTLAAMTAVDNWGALDRLTGIENALGSEREDILLGGDAANTLSGDAGADTLLGGGGDDVLRGNSGNDILRGGAGTDTADYGDAVDSSGVALDGVVVNLSSSGIVRAGVSVAAGTARDNWGDVDTLEGVENATGSAAADVLVGGDGNNFLVGLGGDDTLEGGAGNDTFAGGDGANLLVGGAGDDVFLVTDARDVLVEAAGGGLDTALYGISGATNALNVEQAQLFGAATFLTGSSGAETLFANAALGSTLDGAGGDDVLFGSAAADTLRGGSGNDTLFGGGGADRLEGGGGDDLYAPADVGALVVEAAGEGTDTVVFAGDFAWTLGAHAEYGLLIGTARLLQGADTDGFLVNFSAQGATIAGGAGADILFGAADFADTLSGGAGGDTIYGMGGGDLLRGGLGDDLMVVFSLSDRVEEAEGEGADTVFAAVDGWLAEAGGVEIFGLAFGATFLRGGAGAQNLVANAALGSTLDGGAGNDVLFGKAGNDTLSGGAGDDVYLGGGGLDVIRLDAPGWGNDNAFDMGAGMRVDLRGSGVAGLPEVGFLAFDGGTMLMTAQGTLALWGLDAAQAEAALIF